MAGSPFFLKNFMHTLGHFDIYGCAAGDLPAADAGALRLPSCCSPRSPRSILILIHHIHLLMYVPTIAVIVVLRYYLVQGLTGRTSPSASPRRWRSALLFLAAQFWGTMAVPGGGVRPLSAEPDGRSRARPNLLSFSYIWYQPLSKEIHDTWERMPSNILGIPVFALLIWLHAPLWRYFADLIRALAEDLHRRVVIAAHRDRERGLSGDVCDRVRLFAMDLELGGLHVPDPARGQGPARLAKPCRRSRRDDPKTTCSRLDRDADPARRDRAAVLIGRFSRVA